MRGRRTSRVKTGISGIDSLIDGGLPRGSVLLLPGCVGSGKTIFSLQFIAQGARKFNERGLYISFEEHENRLREQASRFGWDFDSMERKGMVKLIRLPGTSLGQILEDLEKTINSFKPKRLVIDSFTFMSLAAHTRNRLVDIDKIPADELLYGEPKGSILSSPLEWNTIVVKKMATDLVLMLQEKGITTILTSEISKNSEWFSRDTVSEFACDGVFLLRSTSMGAEMQRTIEIVKLRNSAIRGGVYSFEFGKSGIHVSGSVE